MRPAHIPRRYAAADSSLRWRIRSACSRPAARVSGVVAPVAAMVGESSSTRTTASFGNDRTTIARTYAEISISWQLQNVLSWKNSSTVKVARIWRSLFFCISGRSSIPRGRYGRPVNLPDESKTGGVSAPFPSFGFRLDFAISLLSSKTMA